MATLCGVQSPSDTNSVCSVSVIPDICNRNTNGLGRSRIVWNVFVLCAVRSIIGLPAHLISIFLTVVDVYHSSRLLGHTIWTHHFASISQVLKNQLCDLVNQYVLKAFELAPEDGFCELVPGAFFWSLIIFMGACVIRWIWLLPVWARLRAEAREFRVAFSN